MFQSVGANQTKRCVLAEQVRVLALQVDVVVLVANIVVRIIDGFERCIRDLSQAGSVIEARIFVEQIRGVTWGQLDAKVLMAQISIREVHRLEGDGSLASQTRNDAKCSILMIQLVSKLGQLSDTIPMADKMLWVIEGANGYHIDRLHVGFLLSHFVWKLEASATSARPAR